MHLIVDVAANRICIDGCWTSGRRRWEAAALGILIQPHGCSDTSVVSREALARELLALGQDTALDRTGWRRLWAGVARLFESLGREEDFALRFSHRPRALTVGPWWWQADVKDVTEVRGIEAGLRATDTHELHAVAADRSLESTLLLARKLAIVHSLWLYGSRHAAIEELVSGPEWALAAPPISAHRALTLADAYTMTEQYSLARQQLRVVFRLIDRHPTCRDQRTMAEFIRLAIAESGKRGTSPSSNTAEAILQLLADRRRSSEEIDTRSRAWAYLHAAHGLRGMPSDSAPTGADRELLRRRQLDLISASVCLAIVGWNSDLIPITLEGFLRELTPFAGAGDAATLSLCVDAYLAAQLWRSALEIPNSFEIGRLWLAMLVADHPEVTPLVDERVASGAWIGQRPDTVAYFQETLTLSIHTGDPKYTARAALACYRFADRAGSRALRSKGEAVFLQTCREYKTVVLFLRTLGLLGAVPELAAKI